MSVSTIPACLDALVAAWTAALPDVQVVDGQPLTTEPDVVCVGFTGQPGEAAVEATESTDGLTIAGAESYDVACLASSWRGDADVKTVRDRAFALVEAAAGTLLADPTLGGTVTQARLSTQALATEQTTQGAVATVAFTVHVDAFPGH